MDARVTRTLENLSPILRSLEPVRDQVTAYTNLELQPAYPGSHATSNSAFLSAARAKLTESTDYYLGTTVDQVAAKAIGHHTRLPSLELAMDLLQLAGQCDNGYAFAGGGGSGIRGNRHVRYDDPVPLANLHLSLLDRVGVQQDSFGDSDGMISL